MTVAQLNETIHQPVRLRTMAALVSVMAVAIVIPLALIIGYVFAKGLPYLRLTFFTTTMADVSPTDPATQAGGLQAIVGTVEQVGIAALISIPLGVLTAVYLNEVRGRLQRPVRIFVDAMSGTPSIVAALFIYAVLVSKSGFSGFSAALALSVLMLPTVTRTSASVPRSTSRCSISRCGPHTKRGCGRSDTRCGPKAKSCP